MAHTCRTQSSQTTMSTGSKPTRMKWNKQVTNIFVNVCMKAVDGGRREGNCFGPKGWTYIQEEFCHVTGLMYSKQQLRNKWDWMKKEWRMWNSLVGNEVLEWNPIKGTIDASDEWWTEKLKVAPNFAKFRKEGVEPELLAKYGILFANTVTTREHDTPSSNVDSNVQTTCVDTVQDVVPLEGSGNFEEEHSEQSMDKIVSGGNVSEAPSMHETHDGSNSAGTDSSETKQKRLDESFSEQRRNKKARRQSVGSMKSRDIFLENRSTSTAAMSANPLGTSIFEVMTDLRSLPNLVISGPFHLFAMHLLEEKTKREVYATLQSSQEKMDWLNYHYGLRKATD